MSTTWIDRQCGCGHFERGHDASGCREILTDGPRNGAECTCTGVWFPLTINGEPLCAEVWTYLTA